MTKIETDEQELAEFRRLVGVINDENLLPVGTMKLRGQLLVDAILEVLRNAKRNRNRRGLVQTS